MSFEALKENQGAVRLNSNSEATCDIFALEQPTGRPSILRQSQVDNISRTVPRGAKVCFQTPRRDPVTKKIMSPSRTSRAAIQEDGSKGQETFTDSTDQCSETNTSTMPIDKQNNSIGYSDDDMPVQSKGSYMLDLDNLNAINPFLGSNKMANSPPKSSGVIEACTSELIESDAIAALDSAPQADVPEVTSTSLDETLPFVPSVENSLADCSANISSAEGTVILKTENIENSTTDSGETDITDPVPASLPVIEDQPEPQDLPLPPAGSYNLDFDNLDLLNPFQTGGSKIPNSPQIVKASAVSEPPLQRQEDKQDLEPSVQTPDVPSSSDASTATQENFTVMESSSSAVGPKENNMLLEFNFDDGAEVKRKPPPKRLGVKRSAGTKPVIQKPDAPVTERKEPKPKQISPKRPEETEPVDVPVSKGSYTFDSDKFDDPNFNPFGTKEKMGNSPPRGVQTSPVLMKAPAPDEQPEAPVQDDKPEAPVQDDKPDAPVQDDKPDAPVQDDKAEAPVQDDKAEAPVQDHQPLNRSPQGVSESSEMVAETEVVNKQLADDVDSTPTVLHTNIAPQNPATQEPELLERPKSKADILNQTCELGVVTPSEDEFVPGAFFMPGGVFDGQIDYLEQFGSSTFKESALRKQSLYLKFDPLLKESPKKNGFEGSGSGFSLPRPSLAIRMMEAAKSEVKQKSRCESAKLLDDVPPPAVETVVPDPTVLDLLVPTMKQPVKIEDSIIEVLKYSQRDMDAALQKAERQFEEREQELKKENEKLRLENQQVLFLVSEYDATINHITEEHKRKEDVAKTELERVLQEKDQLSKDLNELERSFSSVIKRLDRCKDVIEGFKKNEETLKQYSQNCMDRLQKEEKRYHALKAHAEEKLDQANKAIAEIRTKQGAEMAALQVQFKREQLKVQSLEKDLEQKTKEVKDVSQMCDELLLKVQKHGF